MSTNDYLPTIDRDAQRYELWNRIAVWCKCPRGAGAEVAADAIDEELDTMLQAYACEAVASRWIPVEARLPAPGMYVLVACAGRVLRALHAPRFTLSEDEWGEFDTGADYDEATDASYWPEGWYEVNQHEETHWQLDNEPTLWMPLPPLPKEQIA